MCTAMTYKTKDHYFGRTLDIECCYGEELVLTPRQYPFSFRMDEAMNSHYGILGMAAVRAGYPLYFDGMNEMGLGMAGLNFPGFACYFPPNKEKRNVTPFELIPLVLGTCKTVEEARKLLKEVNVCHISFSEEMPLTPLHWMIADKEKAIVAESVKDGLKVYDNPVGVMTNAPSFNYHMTHLCDYMHLSNRMVENRFGFDALKAYSRGMGAMGLPGDWSSASRFIRAAFVKMNSTAEKSELSSVGQFFHMMAAVSVPKGCMQLEDGQYQITAYTSCMNLDRKVYYYTTYENNRLTAVNLHRFKLEGCELKRFPLFKTVTIHWQN